MWFELEELLDMQQIDEKKCAYVYCALLFVVSETVTNISVT